jgi:copper(I)-binding protein
VISITQWYSVQPLNHRVLPLRLLCLLLLIYPALSHGEASLSVTSAWLRGVPPGQSNSAAYMTLTNNSSETRRLLAVSSTGARAVEIHESMQVDGMWRMRALSEVVIAAGTQFHLQPGGAHLMVFGLVQPPQVDDTVLFTLQLDNKEEIQVAARVRAPGQTAH